MRHVSDFAQRLAIGSAKDENRAFRWLVQPSDHPQQRGFSRAILATQDVEPPCRQFERNSSYCRRAAINLGDIFNSYGECVRNGQRTSVSFRLGLSRRRLLLLLLRSRIL